MPITTPSEKLAQALEALLAFQNRGTVAIRSRDLKRAHRERLTKTGFLEKVMKGWYTPSRPELPNFKHPGNAWCASFWAFCASYLHQRFNQAWCLSSEQSLLLHAENWTLPKKLLVRTPKGDNKVRQLPCGTSLLTVKYTIPAKADIEENKGLNIVSKIPALISVTPKFFTQHPTEARTILLTVRDASEVLPILLEGGHSTIAGRLAGAFRNVGKLKIADDIIKAMQAADFDVRENDPFETKVNILLSSQIVSPYVNRIRLLWHQMRKDVIAHFPKPHKPSLNVTEYLKTVDEKYVMDAYHSLSIENYRVSIELIKHVCQGKWNPALNENDKKDHNALAARGYWQAFQIVKKSIEKIIKGENAGNVTWRHHGDWYRELFMPSVTAELLTMADLSGYRDHPVYIRHSQHVPPNVEAVRELMPSFFDLLKSEKEASVRVVLGHFFFVYIHPYIDGNGRLGRFLMNAMCASGGYPWMIIPVEKRNPYMAALENASVNSNIIPFCKFLSEALLNAD